MERIKQIPFSALPVREKLISFLVPILAFGGIGVAYLLSFFGIIENAGTFAWGCILSSLVLSYLAYLKPKKDIVALLTPVYAVIIFFGLENASTLFLQILYAITITMVLIRLNRRFSS